MNTKTQDLETEARTALDLVTRHGVNGIVKGIAIDRALQYGLEQGLFNQKEIDAAQTTYERTKARTALDLVTRHGVNGIVKGIAIDRALQYGLEQGLFDKKEIDAAQTTYERTKARTALDLVASSVKGIAIDRDSVWIKTRDIRRQGILEQGILEQEEIDATQTTYEPSQK